MKLAVAIIAVAACRAPELSLGAAADAHLYQDAYVGGPLLVQSASYPPYNNDEYGSGSSAFVVTLAAPTAIGHLLVVGVELDSSAEVAAVSDDALPESAVFTAIPAASAVDSASGKRLELWYAPVTSSSATHVGVEANGLIHAAVVWEFLTMNGMAIDAMASSSDQPLAPHPVSPAVTTSTVGEIVVVAVASSAHVVGNDAIQGFAEDGVANYDGWAHLGIVGNAVGTYYEEWDTPPAGTYCASVVAFAAAN